MERPVILFCPKVPSGLKDTNSRSVLLATEVWHAQWLVEQGELASALPLSRSALELAEELVQADPRNLLGLLYRHHAELVFGRAEVLSGAIDDGFKHIDHALGEEEALLERDPGFAYISAFVTLHSIEAGKTAMATGGYEQARRHFGRAVELANAQRALHPADAQAFCNLSEAEHGLSAADPANGAQHAGRARAAARKVLDVHPDNPSAQKLLR